MKRFMIQVIFVSTIMLNGWTLNSQQVQSFIVTNKTDVTVTTVYISPAGANSWGNSINTKDKLLSGESFQFTQIIDNTKCSFDVKFTGEDAKAYFMTNVNLCSGGTLILSKTEEKRKNKIR